MIFKKGTEVEVLDKAKEPFKSWRPARILSGNGHTYGVKYDCCSMEIAVSMNKVPRRALRPRPPLAIRSWACADFVEVFDGGSWKLAEVLRTSGFNMVVARLLGSSKEIIVPLFQLRMAQTWKDDHWIPLQTDSLECKDVDIKMQSKRNDPGSQVPLSTIEAKIIERMGRCKEECDDSADHFSQKSFGRMKKRSLDWGLPVYRDAGAFVKKQQIKKKSCTLAMNNLMNQLFKKVDGADSRENLNGKKHVNDAFSRGTAEFDEVGIYGQKPIANGVYNLIVSLDPSEGESASSVGSCSAVNCFWRPIHHKTCWRQEQCAHIDDAESFCGSPTESCHIREYDMQDTVHFLELDAYRSTLKSLHAAGSISWDQESLLTNLRAALNISIDEHLSELKKLMSSRSSIEEYV